MSVLTKFSLSFLLFTFNNILHVASAPTATRLKGSMIQRETRYNNGKEDVIWTRLTYNLIEMNEAGKVPHVKVPSCPSGTADPMYGLHVYKFLDNYIKTTGESNLENVPKEIYEKLFNPNTWASIDHKGFKVEVAHAGMVDFDHRGGEPTGLCCPEGPMGGVGVVYLYDGQNESPPKCANPIKFSEEQSFAPPSITDPQEPGEGQPVKLKTLFEQQGSGAMFALKTGGIGFQISGCGCEDNRMDLEGSFTPTCPTGGSIEDENQGFEDDAKLADNDSEDGNDDGPDDRVRRQLLKSGAKGLKKYSNDKNLQFRIEHQTSKDGKYKLTHYHNTGFSTEELRKQTKKMKKMAGSSSKKETRMMKAATAFLGDKKSNNKNLFAKLGQRFQRKPANKANSNLKKDNKNSDTKRGLSITTDYSTCQGDPQYMGHNQYPMPPFPQDTVQNLFIHMPPSSQGSIQLARSNEQPDNMHSVFIDAETRQENGECSGDIYVKLPKTEGFMEEPAFQKLVSVDGVLWSCMRSLLGQQAWPVSGQPEWLLLDLIPALRATSGAAPAAGETVKVVVKDSNNADVTREIVLAYANYQRFKPLLKARSQQMHKYPCIIHHFDKPSVIKPGDFVTCARDSTIQAREANDPAVVAMASMDENTFPLVFLTNEYDISTGKKMNNFDPLPPDFKSGNCKVRAMGIVDANGQPIWADEDIPITPKASVQVCEPEAMKALKDEIDVIIKKMQDGESAVSAGSLVALQSDVWTACATFIEKSFQEAFVKRTVDTVSCIHSNPLDTMCPDSNIGEESFCNLNPTHPWCADPCCYWKASRTKCCRAQSMDTNVMIPTMDEQMFGETCKFAGTASASAISASKQYLDTQYNAQTCIPTNSEMQAELTTLDNAAECCHAKIAGIYGNDGKKSIQPCNDDSECLTGRCEIATGDSGGSSSGGSSSGVTVTSPYDTNCFSDSAEISNKQGFCAVADATNFGEMISTCIINTFEDKDMPQAAAMFKHALTGNYNAPAATVGTQIMQSLGSYTCEGPDGYKYDPRNPCQNFNGTMCLPQNCNGADCQTACEAAEKCNWAPWGTTLTAAECSGASSIYGATDTHFCGMKEWGDEIHGMTEPARCRPGGIRILEPWVFQWESHNIKSSYNEYIYASNVTDAQCQTALNDNTAIKKFWRYDYDPATHTQVPIYTCTLPGTGSNALTSDECLAACTGTNGFKPAKRYSCIKRPENLAKCSDYNDKVSTETIFRNEEDPAFRNAHHIRKRPQVCVPSGDWKQMDLTISGVSTEYHWPYSFHWFEATSDADADARCAAISNADITLEKVVMDDGKDQCRQDRCYKIGPTDWDTCNAVLTAGTTQAERDSGAHIWWEETANGGNGLCTLRKSHNDHGGEHIWDENGGRFRTVTDQANYKNWCESKFTGAVFYAGRSFEEGMMDSKTKCEAQYCDVMGPWAAGVSAETCSSTTTCKGGHGCRGCRHNWSNSDAHWGVCKKAAKDKAACDTLGWSYIPKVDGTTGAGMCYQAGSEDESACTDEWVTCESLNIGHCDGDSTTPQASGEAKTTLEKLNDLYLKCKPTQWGDCNTKEKCDAGGQCHGLWLPSEVWDDSKSGHDKSTYFAKTCVKEPGTESQKRQGNYCGIDTNEKTNPRLKNEGGHKHDPYVRHYGDKCAWYTYSSEKECTDDGGNWVSTQLNKERCESFKRCKGGRGDFHDRDQVECEACGGGYNSDATWQDYEWTSGTMVSDPRVVWTERKMQKVNKWMMSIDRWELNNALQSVRDRITKKFEIGIILCLWGKASSFMFTVGAICSETYDYKAEAVKLAECEAMNGVAQSCGNSETVVVDAPDDAFTVVRRTERTRQLSGGMDMLTLKGEMYEIDVTSGGRRQLSNQVSAAALPKRNLIDNRWLSTASTNDASCYSVVMNSASTPVLVGQLLGNCVALTAGGLTLNENSAGIHLCLPIDIQIVQDASYTDWAFAERTGSSENGNIGYKYAAGLTVTNSGTQLCSKVKKLDTYFCPAKVVADSATKTTATGAFSCPAMVQILDTVSQAAIAAGGNIEAATVYTSLDAGSEEEVGTPQELSASVKLPLTILATDTKETLMANSDFIMALKTGIAKALDSTLDASTVEITDITISDSRMRKLDEKRRLSTVSKKVSVDYKVTLPATFSTAKIASITAKTSAGGAGSSAFASSLQTNINQELANNPALASTYQSTGTVVVVGSASTETKVDSSDALRSRFGSMWGVRVVAVVMSILTSAMMINIGN